jgi:hypothetical protein
MQNVDLKEMENLAEFISMMDRALNGLPIREDSKISYFTDIMDLTERTRLPTYPQVMIQDYLRLGYKIYGEVARSLLLWADLHAHSMISYKGGSRTEFVEMKRASINSEKQEFYIGGQPKIEQNQEQSIPQKRHWYSRAPKQEDNELKAQE